MPTHLKELPFSTGITTTHNNIISLIMKKRCLKIASEDLIQTLAGDGEPTFHRNSFQRKPPSSAQLSSPSQFLAAFAAATQE